MSFYKFKECDIISTVYTSYPNYKFEMNTFESDFIFVFNSSSAGVNRTYSDLNGSPVSGAYDLSGVVSFLTSAALTGSEKRSLTTLRNVYASSSFVKAENYTSSSLYNDSLTPENQTIHILNIPQVLYGSEIKPGSVLLQALRQLGTDEYTDDTYGGVFTGSLHVGCVFYQHGIVYLGSKFVSDFLKQVTASFSGTSKIPTNLYLCRVPKGELNFSQNGSYTSVTGSTIQPVKEASTTNPKTLITGVALYDSEYKLVGVGKLSQPVLNEEDTGLLFKIKLSF